MNIAFDRLFYFGTCLAFFMGLCTLLGGCGSCGNNEAEMIIIERRAAEYADRAEARLLGCVRPRWSRCAKCDIREPGYRYLSVTIICCQEGCTKQ